MLPIRTNIGDSKLYFIDEKVKVVKIWNLEVSSVQFLDFPYFPGLFSSAQSDPNLQLMNSQGELLLDCSSKYLENLVEKFRQTEIIQRIENSKDCLIPQVVPTCPR